MRSIHLLLLILSVLLAPGLAARSVADAPCSKMADSGTILVLGDSLSAAYGMEIDESWPRLLQGRLDENGHAYRVFNSSITGDTTQGGLTRLPRLLERHHPDLVILELGGNDGLRGLPLEVTRDNLAGMIEQSRAVGAQVLLAEMRIPPNYGRSYAEKFNATYSELAAEYDVVLLPFLLQEIALEPGLMMGDGIHPTAAAQSVILDAVWVVLEPLL
jgi:acyl-CoA thioesterase-1